MRFFSLAVIASVLAIAQAAPTSGSCYNIKDGSGYLSVVKDGQFAGVSLNKAKRVFFNPIKTRMKVQFQACPGLAKPEPNENGPIYRGRILVPSAGKNMCLTAKGSALTVTKCNSSKKPTGGQKWLSFGEDDYTRRYSFMGNPNGYRADPNNDQSIIPDDVTNYVSLDCNTDCRPFWIKKSLPKLS